MQVAGFLAHIAQETTGGWDTAPGGRYAWGLYFPEEVGRPVCSCVYNDCNRICSRQQCRDNIVAESAMEQWLFLQCYIRFIALVF